MNLLQCFDSFEADNLYATDCMDRVYFTSLMYRYAIFLYCIIWRLLYPCIYNFVINYFVLTWKVHEYFGFYDPRYL